MTNKELIEIANMELRDQLEAERVINAKLKKQLQIVVMALRWYDGLEIMHPYWELATGQKKGTAEEALEKAMELDNVKKA